MFENEKDNPVSHENQAESNPANMSEDIDREIAEEIGEFSDLPEETPPQETACETAPQPPVQGSANAYAPPQYPNPQPMPYRPQAPYYTPPVPQQMPFNPNSQPVQPGYIPNPNANPYANPNIGGQPPYTPQGFDMYGRPIYPSYGQPQYPPYPQPQPYGYPPRQPYGGMPPKKRMPVGVKVFIIVMSILAAVGIFVLGAAIVSYSGTSTSSPNYSDYYGYFDGDSGESADPSATPTPSPDENSGNSSDGIVQPDIEVKPYTAGITIDKKPSGDELSAKEVYAKVLPSTVTVTAEIPLADGSTDESVGTGIFITSDGYIITNSHVIGNTKSSGITITTSDGTDYPCVVVGFDKTTDIAILKTDDHNFTPAEFGDASELAIGEWVIAIGNPGGSTFSGSLTRGVVSGLDRTVGSYSSNGMTYIQTDAAINPGNSGGPLVNMYGQVVGINSSKIVADYFEGMGFAIPVSKAKTIIDQLLSEGYVNGRTRLGITGQNVLYGSPSGVTIVDIQSDSSFNGTDAKAEDIITAVNGTKISGLTSLANELLSFAPGDKVTVTLYRPSDQKEFTVEITLLEDKGETQK